MGKTAQRQQYIAAYADAFGEGALATASETGTVLSSAGNAAAAAAGGFAAGGISGGNIQGAIAGAFQSVALFGVGEALGHTDTGLFQGNHVARIFAHATIGCVTSGVQGGSCGKSAASAGFAAFAGPVLQGNFESDHANFAYEVAGHAVAGGIGARIGGGKFANGVATGAFGYLFNSAAEATKEGEIGRHDAFRQAKADVGLSKNARPDSVDMKDMYDKDAKGNKVLVRDKNGNIVQSREYVFNKGQIRIQEHSIGHIMEGKLQETGHFNVRDADGNTPKGAKPHYYFKGKLDPFKYFWRSKPSVIVPRGSE